MNQLSSRHLNHLWFFDSVTYSNNGQVKCNTFNWDFKVVEWNYIYVIWNSAQPPIYVVTVASKYLRRFALILRFDFNYNNVCFDCHKQSFTKGIIMIPIWCQRTTYAAAGADDHHQLQPFNSTNTNYRTATDK